MRRKYSLTENKNMLEMYYDNKGYDYIASKFNVTHEQAKNHIFYLRHHDWKNRVQKEWSEEELKLLYELVGKYKINTIAKYINRKPSAIYDKMQRIGLSNTREHCSGIVLNQLAKIIKIDNHVIKKWIDSGLLIAFKKSTLFKAPSYFIKTENFWMFARDNKELLNFKKIERGVLIPEPLWLDSAIKNEIKSADHRNIWTNEDDKKLQNLFYQNLSCGEIAKKMNRTYASVTHRMNRLCLNKHYSIPWTNEEIEQLVKMIDEGYSENDISEILGRTVYAVRHTRKRIREGKTKIKSNKWHRYENDNIDFLDKLEIEQR